jgi:hypothetical protein
LTVIVLPIKSLADVSTTLLIVVVASGVDEGVHAARNTAKSNRAIASLASIYANIFTIKITTFKISLLLSLLKNSHWKK